MKSNNLIFSWLLILLLSASAATGQKSLVHTNPDKNFNKALELFDKAKFSAAREIFNEIISKNTNENSLIRCDAEYYQALCAIELFHKDAEYLIDKFIFNHPDDQRLNELYFRMGKYYYQKKSYGKTIEWFEKVDENLLKGDDKTDYYFNLGYSHFSKEEFDKARICFYEIKDIQSEYNSASNYFYSHIAYAEGNYQTALNGFEKIKNDDTFKPIVPYYLTHIYYLKGDYEKIKETAPSLLEKSTPKRAPEIARIIGDAYYRTGEYEKAIPYFLKYKEGSLIFSAQDYYQLANSYFRTGNYSKAITNFEKVTFTKDTLSQNAYFHLADCYLKTDQKQKAQMAFGSAANMEFDKFIQEESLFNFAKLSFELSYSPFNQTIREFENFITKFPESIYIDDAYDYLGKVYMATKNYSQALASIEKIKTKNDNINAAYQRIAFFRGLELFSGLEFEKAIFYFDKSLNFGKYNSALNTRAIFWKAEANYRLGNYQLAEADYNKFLYSTSSINQEEYEIAHYNLAYAIFKQNNYKDAATWFRKYISRNESASKFVADSYVRIGDCYFIQKEYADAVKYYDLAIARNASDVDYATFQKAFSYGLLKEDAKKNWVLRNMVKDFPQSGYKVDALFELGKSYNNLGDIEKALETYTIITKDYSQSNYVKKALLQMGLIHYNSENNEDALIAYKTVVENYSGTPESKNAMVGIKNIYMDMHMEDEYFKYAEIVGNIGSITVNEKDSLTYSSAERLYMQGDCPGSSEHFKKYIENFKDGNFLINAHYYKADCNMKAGNEDEALVSYNFIASKPRNMFTEEALLKAARINFSKEKYKEALDDYQMLESVADLKNNLLEARIGQMRSCYKLKNDTASIFAANKVLISDKVPTEITDEAHFVLAKSFYNKKDFTTAINEFKYISDKTSTIEGAEASYRVAELLFKEDKISDAEEEVLSFNKKNTPHQYWLAKAIILLADIYVVTKDDFKARHTLESVIQYYENKEDGIIELAQLKLNEISERDEGGKLLEDIKDIDLKFDSNKSKEFDNLFDNQPLPADSLQKSNNEGNQPGK